jgi:DNA repair exonuclease SbcCD ATPase subunit
MAIIFKKVRYKNFLSTGNSFTEIDLAKHPTTLIVGENGAGKSTFLDAITFSLFGKPFRNINKPQLINSVNEKDCLVEIEFSISDKSYLVRRGIKPNIFEIFCQGKLINQDAKSKDYQDHLEKIILKMNYKSFTQIVILGSTNFTPFMQLSAADRRAVIEDLLDIQIFSSMNSIAKNKYSSLKEQSNQLKVLIDSVKGKIELHKKHLEELKKNNQELIVNKKKEISENEISLETLNQESISLNESTQSLLNLIVDGDLVNKKNQKIALLGAKIENNVDKIKKEIEFYSKNATCPTCDQTINNKEEKVHNCNNKLHELNSGLEKLKTETETLTQRINAIREIQLNINSLQNSLLQNSTKQNQINGYLKKLNAELVTLENKPAMSDTFKAQSKELLNELVDHNEKRKNCLLDIQNYEVVLALLKDGGIKSKIIKQYVPIINKQVNKYLAAMDFFVNFNIDEEFKETIKSRHRDSFSYENFSEGEKKRIDLALLFTWRAIAKMKNSANTNLLIFDEVFDGSLDNNGTEEFMKLINLTNENTNIFVISHKGDVLTDKFRNIVKFKKVQNFSQMVK